MYAELAVVLHVSIVYFTLLRPLHCQSVTVKLAAHNWTWDQVPHTHVRLVGSRTSLRDHLELRKRRLQFQHSMRMNQSLEDNSETKQDSQSPEVENNQSDTTQRKVARVHVPRLQHRRPNTAIGIGASQTARGRLRSNGLSAGLLAHGDGDVQIQRAVADHVCALCTFCITKLTAGSGRRRSYVPATLRHTLKSVGLLLYPVLLLHARVSQANCKTPFHCAAIEPTMGADYENFEDGLSA